MKKISREHDELNFMYYFLSIPAAVLFPVFTAFELTSVKLVPVALCAQLLALRFGVDLGRKYRLSEKIANWIATVSGYTMTISVVLAIKVLSIHDLYSGYLFIQLLFMVTLALDGWRRYGVLWHLSEKDLRVALKKYESWF